MNLALVAYWGFAMASGACAVGGVYVLVGPGWALIAAAGCCAIGASFMRDVFRRG